MLKRIGVTKKKKKKKLFCLLGENDPPDTFYPTYYARI
jgi:hypothetical protein